MLNAYCRNVLITELSGPDYAGMTADQAWDWLTEPAVTTAQEETGARLTPLLAASVVGPAAANLIAAKVRAALPAIADDLLRDGVSLADPSTAPFLGSLVGDGVTQAHVDALLALRYRAVTVTATARFDRRFDPERWPHVNADGLPGGDHDPAITGFPNAVTRDEFNDAWLAARGD